MSLAVTDDWVTSTRTSESSIRSKACGAFAVHTVSLRLSSRGPQRLGSRSCTPVKRGVRWMMSPLSDGGSLFGCPWRHLHAWRCGGEGSSCCLIYQHRDDRRESFADQRYERLAR